MESPFIDIKKQSELPGPGGYFNPSPKDKILKRIASQQQSKSKFGQKPPFNSSLYRDCNQPLTKEDGVSPNSHLNFDNEANLSLYKQFMNPNSDR